MATLLVKSLAIGAGLTGLTGAAIGAYYLTSNNSKEEKSKETSTKQSITQLLVKEQKQILGDDANEGKANWASFKKNQNKQTPRAEPGNLTDGNAVFDNSEAPASFKAKCKANLEIRINGNTDQRYLDFLSFCTKQA